MHKHISELYIPFKLSTETNTSDTIPCNRNGNNNDHAQLLTDARKAKQNEYKKIENTIIDIGYSLIKMNTIINQQDEVINLIDDNIADTFNNVEKGRFQLYKYLDTLTNQRTFYAKLFLILLVAIVIQIYTNTPYS
jgi:t-SNARE complex subunit (syntaxin)